MNPAKLLTIERITQLLYALAAAVVAMALFLRIVEFQSKVNDDMTRGDQSAYMYFAREANESSFQYTGGRNRMPLYPWLQAIFYSPELSDEEFFDQGKRLNIALTATSLIVVAVAFVSRFSRLFALYAFMVIAYLLFAIKAPWFQAEILFYTLFWLAFALSIESINRPSWKKSVAVGALFALAHFSKASALPGLLIYAASFAVRLLQKLYYRELRVRFVLTHLGYAAIPIAVFALLLLPYLNESKERYGHYLYNVNTTFYMWYDSWEEVKGGTRAAGDRVGWPELPDEEIPSLSKYLSEHSTAEIIARFSNSASDFYADWCGSTFSSIKFGSCTHARLSLYFLVGAFALILYRNRQQMKRINLQRFFFIICFLFIYVLAALWYAPIVHGPRVMFALLLPLFWTVGLAEQHTGVDRYEIVAFGHIVKPLQWIYSLLFLFVVYQALELAAHLAANLYGGS